MNQYRLRLKLLINQLWSLTVCIICLRSRLMGFAALGSLSSALLSFINPICGLIPVAGFGLATYFIARKKNGRN